MRHLAKVADGDARKALNSLEIAALTTPPGADGVILIDLAAAEQCIQKKAVVYDADGDAHYDTISAFIKSMRGSDVDAALYWLAKMIHAGEDPRFITPAHHDLRGGGRRPGGSDGAGAGGGGASDGGIRRLAGGAHPYRGGGHLHRHRQQEQQRLSGH